MFATLSGWMLGLLFGMRHALEPDHLAAVSTLVSERRTGREGVMLGAAWGVGHTLTLTLVGGGLLVFRARVPERIEVAFELLVSFMLLVLGTRTLLLAARVARVGAARPHAHALGGSHTHEGPRAHVHVGQTRLATRPLLVGLVHGLAGTGALTAAALAEFPDPVHGVLYIALFGLGSTIGMAGLTGALGIPLARALHKPRAARIVGAVTGIVSLVVAVGWGAANVARLFS
jgi:high-affinity nickel-transport protein